MQTDLEKLLYGALKRLVDTMPPYAGADTTEARAVMALATMTEDEERSALEYARATEGRPGAVVAPQAPDFYLQRALERMRLLRQTAPGPHFALTDDGRMRLDELASRSGVTRTG